LRQKFRLLLIGRKNAQKAQKRIGLAKSMRVISGKVWIGWALPSRSLANFAVKNSESDFSFFRPTAFLLSKKNGSKLLL